ncbi:MAG: response regulator transcription factor [Bacteroidota bacterium]|nr:response regulator transcription factor [Bacteroidota bacterium]MDP4206672.1 response regulator transcription factor [Bacteroidota bacterium]
MAAEKIRCLIVDDEESAREVMKYHLSSIEDVEIIGSVSNAEEALYKILELEPDVTFLDIQMPGKSGLSILEIVNKYEIDTSIIFVTAYDCYAIEAIKNSAVDYILKPVNSYEISTAINKVRNREEKYKDVASIIMDTTDKDPKLRLGTSSGFMLIRPEDIVYCQAEGSYSSIYLSSKRSELTNYNLRKLEDTLEKYKFVRANRSILINLAYLKRIDKLRCICTLYHEGNDYTFKMSKFQIKKFLEHPFVQEHTSGI